MDSRSFIAGVACGALVAVAAGWFLAGEDEKEVFAEPPPEGLADSVSSLKPVESTTPSAGKAKAIVDDPSASETGTTNETRAESAAPWPANQWEKLELEPKDDSWAYYMEQALLQFLGSHPSMSQFDISRIECRMTKCQLEVVGFDESSVPAWQQVIYDIRQQPWSEFGQYATSSGNVDGRLIVIGTLWRQPEQE